VLDWAQLMQRVGSYDRALLPWELAEGNVRDLDALVNKVRRVLIIIGPEGGLSHREAELAREHGAALISLGRRILRTETAGLVAIAFARYAAEGVL
jgi:16S rRNA (uracil1498-N3)-methyltransferase